MAIDLNRELTSMARISLKGRLLDLKNDIDDLLEVVEGVSLDEEYEQDEDEDEAEEESKIKLEEEPEIKLGDT
jgi:hypothetical protein